MPQKCMPIPGSRMMLAPVSLRIQFKMKRNPRKLKWTKAFRRAAGKEMTVDSTLTFAARRNIPVRYDRDLVSTTLKAMDRVAEIRARREKVFHKKRMAGNKEREKLVNAKIVAEQSHLLPRIRGSEKRKELDDMAAETMAEDHQEELLREEISMTKVKRHSKNKNRLLVGGGVQDEMEVD